MHKVASKLQGFCYIALILAIAVGIRAIYVTISTQQPLTLLQQQTDSLDSFEQELMKKSANKHTDTSSQRIHPQGQLFAFDPNHADSATLVKIGLTKWQIRNMMAYRSKGGIWHSSDDFARLYGLHPEDFKLLRPYIRIAQADRRKAYIPYEKEYPYGTPVGEKPHFEKAEKYAEGTVIDLNTADTTQLKMVPGIGTHYARMIVDYRSKLGGFISTRQLDEIDGLPAGISRWFNLSGKDRPTRLRINHASFKQLVHHPYLSYEQTKVIVNHIRHYGPIQSWHDLTLYKEFSEADFNRLSPYIDFR